MCTHTARPQHDATTHVAGTRALLGACVDQERVTGLSIVHGAVGDPDLAAVQQVGAIILPHGVRAHRQHVGAARWLRHGHATHRLAGARGWQQACTLLVVAVLLQVVGEQHGVGEVG